MNRLQDDNRKIELNTNKFNIIYPYFYFKKIGEYDRPIFYILTVDYNLFRSGSDYQKKYLKYKQKYLKYKQKYLKYKQKYLKYKQKYLKYKQKYL